ncbi:putative sphingosine kinase A, B [Trypanosoma rangeli]|uniref:Putative sphingosine kinase A, B n=1 Tax=Trypanosoma rangeli TaxID=5698 RepID=A0A3R7LWR9_TRYRA|nr:putative sphingosine kinase A, B [Trypanosoma rangeli]RNF04856.1 putative sphingosine kinase A, B [Trypanosoma rangeli]|eukprot:RNF04856.1 putative sphingosine kinase A, B [Trypanosoma rangeli]
MSSRNSRVQESGKPPRLQAWVIINPTSGQGKGELLQRRIERMLRMEFGDCVARVRVASELISSNGATVSRNANHSPISPLKPTSPSFLSFTEAPHKLGPAANDATTNCSCQGGIRVDIVATEQNIRGREVAQHLTKMVVMSRLRRCLNDEVAAATEYSMKTTSMSQKENVDSLHVFVAVGGDGSLSDVVNGMCRGTLEAFREIIPTCMQSDASSTSDMDSMQYYWQSLEDRSILRHFLPPLIYIPAGTGTDFAKLGLGCRNAQEFVKLLRSVWEHLPPCSSPTTSAQVLTGTNGTHSGEESSTTAVTEGNTYKTNDLPPLEFEVYDVDVARVFFPRSGRNHFFINECSCGMSCDVIEKCEAYKESKLLSLLGGKLMFAVASIVSVYQVRPKPFRLVALPEFASLPSNSLVPRRIGSDLLHQHLVMNDVALRGVQRDFKWVKRSAATEALPATEPLRFGANYYAYDVQGESVASDRTASAAYGKNGRQSILL